MKSAERVITFEKQPDIFLLVWFKYYTMYKNTPKKFQNFQSDWF